MEKLLFSVDIKDTEKKLSFIHDQNNGYKVTKCSKLSTDIRNEGNKLFNSDHHDKNTHLQILKCYTKCIAYAPSGTEELAKGYGNRSMLLFHLGLYKHCVTDVDHALLVTQENRLKFKLLVRKLECLVLLYLDGMKNSQFWEVVNKYKSMVGDEVSGDEINVVIMLNAKVDEFVKKLPNKKAAAPGKKDVSERAQFPAFVRKGEIPCATDGLALRYNNEFGRHLTATRELKAGEILMIEDGIVYANPSNAYITCSHCVEATYNGIPCDGCVFAVYCSEKCKHDAWTSYHDKECTQYDYYKILQVSMRFGTNDFDKLIIFLMLLRRVLVISLKGTNEKSVDSLCSKFFGAGEKQDKRGFKVDDRLEALGSLSSHEKENEYKLKYYLPFVYMLSVDVLSMESDSDFKMMLRLVPQAVEKLLGNTFTVFLDGLCDCTPDVFGAEHRGDCINRRGMFLASFCSLVNHSCVNNANFHIVNGKIVLYANRPIKADEQIFINYGLANLEKETSQRQRSLSMRYHFTCNCQACRENWPVIPKEKYMESAESSIFKAVENLKNCNPDDFPPKYKAIIDSQIKSLNFDVEKLSLDVGVELVKNKTGVKMDIGKGLTTEPQYFFSVDPELYAESKTIHDIYAKNELLPFLIKSFPLQLKLSSLILNKALCYDEKHFNVSDNCPKK